MKIFFDFNEFKEEHRFAANRIMNHWFGQGKLVEGGWQVFAATVFKDESERTLRNMRKVYFLGAMYTFANTVPMMNEGQEPTEKDFERLRLISKELEEYRKTLMT